MHQLTSEMTVEFILEQWPETAVFFTQELKTACVGCPIAPFDTLEDVARIYDFDLNEILSQLLEVINQPAHQQGE